MKMSEKASAVQQFKGTGVAIVTPFEASGQIDFPALETLIEHLITGEVEYLVSLGTTGESATLTTEEKHAVLDFTVEKVNGRIPVVAGFGGNNTAAVVNSIKGYHFRGIDAILSVSPYYNKPTQEGIYHHYMAIDEVAPVPIILYNVPARTGSNMTAETTLRLARDSQKIFAIKEASGDLVQFSKILRDRPADFLVISGDDAITLPALGLGIDGVISVIANAWPQQFSDMVRLAYHGDFEKSRELHLQLLEAMELLFAEGNPGGVKCALAGMGIIDEHLRLPCYPVSNELRKRIHALTAQPALS